MSTSWFTYISELATSEFRLCLMPCNAVLNRCVTARNRDYGMLEEIKICSCNVDKVGP